MQKLTMNSLVAKITSSKPLSSVFRNLIPQALNAPSITLVCKDRGVKKTIPASFLVCVSPLIREMLIDNCCCSSSHPELLLPQFDEEGITKLIQLITSGKINGSLKTCSQVLDLLYVLGVESSDIKLTSGETPALASNQAKIKSESIGLSADSTCSDGNDEDLSILYEGMADPISTRCRLVGVSTSVKMETVENSGNIDNCCSQIINSAELSNKDTSSLRIPRLTNLRSGMSSNSSLSPETSGSSIGSTLSFDEVVRAGLLSRER